MNLDAVIATRNENLLCVRVPNLAEAAISRLQ
jgi:hypothetical protein